MRKVCRGWRRDVDASLSWLKPRSLNTPYVSLQYALCSFKTTLPHCLVPGSVAPFYDEAEPVISALLVFAHSFLVSLIRGINPMADRPNLPPCTQTLAVADVGCTSCGTVRASRAKRMHLARNFLLPAGEDVPNFRDDTREGEGSMEYSTEYNSSTLSAAVAGNGRGGPLLDDRHAGRHLPRRAVGRSPGGVCSHGPPPELVCEGKLDH